MISSKPWVSLRPQIANHLQLRRPRSLEVHELLEVIKRLWIRHRRASLHRLPAQNLLHCALHLFPVDRHRDLRRLQHELGDVARREARADRLAQPLGERRVELVARVHPHEEEDVLVLVLWPTAADAKGLGHGGVEEGPFGDAIDLTATEADTGGVENTVAISNE